MTRVLYLGKFGVDNSVGKCISFWVKRGGGEVESVISLRQVEERLSQGGIDWVVIHHQISYGDCEEVDKLRARFPKVKYAAASGTTYGYSRASPGSILEGMYLKIKEHYDFVLDNLADSILDMMKINQ